jgi:hypothetical protein
MIYYKTNVHRSTSDLSICDLSITVNIISDPLYLLYLFSAEHEGVNETKSRIPPDTYSPAVLVVNEGGSVTIHFYNLDTTGRHTFTMGSPYNINEDLLPGKNATFTFKAADEGVF